MADHLPNQLQSVLSTLPLNFKDPDISHMHKNKYCLFLHVSATDIQPRII